MRRPPRWLHLRSTTAWLIAVAIAAGGTMLGILVWGGLHTAIEATNRLEFCIGCHEMAGAPYAEYRQSIHFANASGVRAVCADCHVPREWWPKIVRKVEATGELIAHLRGTIDTPDKFEAQRLAMARKVWAQMEANGAQECRNCHSWEAMDFHRQRPAAVAQMQKGAAEGTSCIACHKGVAHRMPDLAQGVRHAFDALLALAAREGARAATLTTIATSPLWLERPAGAPEGAGDGRLLPATSLTVVERQGEWLRVRIAGWQQEGAARALYALRGQRILLAALSAEAAERVVVGAEETDADTGLVWRPATLEAWVAPTGLLGERAPLWAYGEQLYADTCGACHAAHPKTHLLANQWMGLVAEKKARTSLDDEQARFLLKYLQLNARDTVAAGG